MNYTTAPGILRTKEDKKYLPITLENIFESCCIEFKVKPEKVRSKIRKHEIVLARQTFFFFARKFTPNSLLSLGEFIGGYDHTTVIHSVKQIENYLDTDEIMRLHIASIQNRIYANNC